MNRRELLRALGTAALLPPLSGLSPGRLVATGRRMHRRARSRALQVLDPHQSETVATIAELIIPATDTPGARAAQVDRFIDLLLADWATDDDRASFLDRKSTRLNSSHGYISYAVFCLKKKKKE